jgi:DNA-binding SARP family transcriptional activator
VLDFRILGPLEVVDGGVSLELGGQKQRALLALLVLEGGRVVSTDALVDRLWGEQPPRTAEPSLRNFVSALRKTLGSDVLVTRPPGYALRVRPEQVDLERFRARVEEARSLAPEERARTLSEALALWRGTPLAEFAFEPWAEGEVARLEELRLAALEARIEADLESGRDAELVGELEALVKSQPLRERLRRLLMLALYRSGRQAEALAAYQSARRALVHGLGIEPSPELQALHGAILRQEVGLQAPGTEPPPEDHFAEVAKELLAGRVVPVLGSDVSELATHLARRFEYPAADGELTRISQYVAVMQGPGPLYDELHALCAVDATPTPVHRFLASLPPLLRERGAPHQLIVTTGYDLALETAFADAGHEFDVVLYLARGRDRGRFCHVTPAGEARLVELPNTYTDLSLDRRTVILKLHGGVDLSPARTWESFVVTEDDYIDYLAQTELTSVVPVSLAAKLSRSHLLFLGYTMADWRLRTLVNRLWGDGSVAYRSWAVQPEAKPLERQFWRRRDVEVVERPLADYVDALGRYAGLEPAEAA